MIREKKALSAILVTLTVALLLTMSMSVAYATKPTKISGTWRPTSGSTYIGPEKTVGGNHFDVITNTGQYLLWCTILATQTLTLSSHRCPLQSLVGKLTALLRALSMANQVLLLCILKPRGLLQSLLGLLKEHGSSLVELTDYRAFTDKEHGGT